MDVQSLVVVGKRTQSLKTRVHVPASLIELPANTWANMVTYLKGLA